MPENVLTNVLKKVLSEDNQGEMRAVLQVMTT